MRFLTSAFVLLFGLSIVGCGDDSSPQTMDVSEVESYVAENAEAVVRQDELDAAREAEEEAEEAEDE